MSADCLTLSVVRGRADREELTALFVLLLAVIETQRASARPAPTRTRRIAGWARPVSPDYVPPNSWVNGPAGPYG